MKLKTYLQLDATDMAELVQKKEVQPSELLNLSFEQLDKVNPSLNAVTHIRREKVLEEAKQMKIGDHPFVGVPFLLKNISQSLKDEPITSGSTLLKSTISAQDSYFVAKLRHAGFLFTGHTNTPEFGLKNITEPELHGPTRNPWHIDYSQEVLVADLRLQLLPALYPWQARVMVEVRFVFRHPFLVFLALSQHVVALR